MKLRLGLVKETKQTVLKLKVFNFLADKIWARTQSLQMQNKNFTVSYLNKETAEITLNLLKDEVGNEDERSKVIDTKLQGILSLISIGIGFISIVIGFLLKDFDVTKLNNTSLLTVFIVFIFAFYISLQILRCLVAVLNGLKTRGYSYLENSDLISAKDEKKETFQLRLTKNLLKILRDNQETTDRKADQLNIAHAAIGNSLWASMLLALYLIAVALIKTIFAMS